MTASTIQASALRHSITIEAQSATVDTAGQRVRTWSDVFGLSLRAEVLTLSGREVELAQAIAPESTVQVNLRYAPGITSAMRVNFGGRLFNILHVHNVEQRNRRLELLCSEGTNEG